LDIPVLGHNATWQNCLGAGPGNHQHYHSDAVQQNKTQEAGQCNPHPKSSYRMFVSLDPMETYGNSPGLLRHAYFRIGLPGLSKKGLPTLRIPCAYQTKTCPRDQQANPIQTGSLHSMNDTDYTIWYPLARTGRCYSYNQV